MIPEKLKHISSAVTAVFCLCLVISFSACSGGLFAGTDEQENTVAAGDADVGEKNDPSNSLPDSDTLGTNPSIPTPQSSSSTPISVDVPGISSSSMSENISPTVPISSSQVADVQPDIDEFIKLVTTSKPLSQPTFTGVEKPDYDPSAQAGSPTTFNAENGVIKHTLFESGETVFCDTEQGKISRYSVSVEETFVIKALESDNENYIETFEQSCTSESGRFILSESGAYICSLELSRRESPNGSGSYTDPSWPTFSLFIIEDCTTAFQATTN